MYSRKTISEENRPFVRIYINHTKREKNETEITRFPRIFIGLIKKHENQKKQKKKQNRKTKFLGKTYQKGPSFVTVGDLTFSNQPQYSGLQCTGDDTIIGVGGNGPADPFQFVKHFIRTSPTFPSFMAS